MDPAPTGREGPCLDVQPLNERPPDKLEIDAANLRAQHSCDEVGRRALASDQCGQQRFDWLWRGVLAAAGGRRVRFERVAARLRRRRRALGGAGDAVELLTRLTRLTS